MTNNRRRFHRIQVDCTAAIEFDGKTCDTQLLDISLNGVLLTRTPEWNAQCGTSCRVRIRLDDDATQICMEGSVVHIEEERLGVRCEHIDIESAGHLRRIVELNLGDAELLNRELSVLV